MKVLLIIMAVAESAIGVALLAWPPAPVEILLGARLDGPSGLLMGRLAGAALLSLGLACWGARTDSRGPAGAGLLTAMSVYNLAAVGLLTYAAAGAKMIGPGLWPGICLHAGLAAWCLACLRKGRAASGSGHGE
jgi:hypothetical protein